MHAATLRASQRPLSPDQSDLFDRTTDRTTATQLGDLKIYAQFAYSAENGEGVRNWAILRFPPRPTFSTKNSSISPFALIQRVRPFSGVHLSPLRPFTFARAIMNSVRSTAIPAAPTRLSKGT